MRKKRQQTYTHDTPKIWIPEEDVNTYNMNHHVNMEGKSLTFFQT